MAEESKSSVTAGGDGSSPSSYALLVDQAAQVVVVAGGNEGRRGTAAMNEVNVLLGHSVLVGNGGRIAKVLPAAEMSKFLEESGATVGQRVDAKGKTVVPGFVDSHTHAVFDGDRSHEMAMKLAGKTYIDIYKAGGGIQFTVRKTRACPQEELERLLRQRLDRMLRCGTTTVEVKSGYGLDVETEMKMLRVIHNVNKTHPVDCIATFCGAHAVPPDRDVDAQTKDVVEVQIPELVRLREAGEISPVFVDIFCEKGFFEREHTREILKAGSEAGLIGNFHGDELNPMESGQLAKEAGSRCVAHLEHTSPADMAAMAEAGVFGVLLPTTAFVLRIEPPPARALIDAGVPVALGSDFNPNAFCLSMPFVMNLACVNMRMTMQEALVAATINSAAALNVGDTVGSIEAGKLADFVIYDVPKWEHVIYQMGDGPPVDMVCKNGRVVVKGGRTCYDADGAGTDEKK